MSDNREFYGSSVDEAVSKAAAVLNIERDALDFDVVDEGSVGFLGIGARDARILVRNAASSQNWVNSAAVVEETFAEKGPVTEEVAVTEPEYPAEPEPTLGTDVDSEVSESDDAERPLDNPVVFEETSSEVLVDVRQFTEDLLVAVGFEGRVDVYDAGEFVAVDVATPDAGLFIGQKGETIDAFQHLLNVIAYKDRPFGKRLMLDSEGYRQRRVEALQGMAHRSARRASREQRTVELPPMNASERRIVHVYLQENGDVSTASQGSGGDRRVTISPAT